MFSEQTETFVLYNINSLVFITDVESVYSAVRTESWYNTVGFFFKGLIRFFFAVVNFVSLVYVCFSSQELSESFSLLEGEVSLFTNNEACG